MVEPYLDRGHTSTIDSWYTTLRLAKYLLHRSTKVIGTVRSNRNKFPKDFPGDKEMQKGSAVFKEHENTEELRIKQLENQTIHVILTKHSARMVNTSKVDGQGNTIRKPEAIVYYNTNMGGIDRMDQQSMESIQVLRKT